MASRSRHGVSRQAGYASRAALIASRVSSRVPTGNLATTMSESIGDRSSNVFEPMRSSEPMSIGYVRPRSALARSSAASKDDWSSSLSAESVAYVIFMRGVVVAMRCGASIRRVVAGGRQYRTGPG